MATRSTDPLTLILMKLGSIESRLTALEGNPAPKKTKKAPAPEGKNPEILQLVGQFDTNHVPEKIDQLGFLTGYATGKLGLPADSVCADLGLVDYMDGYGLGHKAKANVGEIPKWDLER